MQETIKLEYIKEILGEEFEEVFKKISATGTLQFELINLLNFCSQAFDEFGFTEENEDDRRLHYAITGAISEYLENNQ